MGGRSSHCERAFPLQDNWIHTYIRFAQILNIYREKAFVVIPPVMRICATSNGEQRVQVLHLVVQGLSQKLRQLMQQYIELVEWQELKLRLSRENEIV